jgi:hypothetical protein
MPKEFKLSKFEHYILRYMRNGGLMIRDCDGKRYEVNPYDEWGGSNKFVTKYLVNRLQKNGYLREVNLSDFHEYGLYYQNTDEANALHWDYKNLNKATT